MFCTECVLLHDGGRVLISEQSGVRRPPFLFKKNNYVFFIILILFFISLFLLVTQLSGVRRPSKA